MKKKGFGLWVLFFIFWVALICMCFSIFRSTSTPTLLPAEIAGNSLPRREEAFTMSRRSLQGNIHARNCPKGDGRSMHLEDYHPIDPVPSSKASIRPGPIQHGTPLMPYIPKPSPPGPGHPKHDGFP